jgi:hypothetical protein
MGLLPLGLSPTQRFVEHEDDVFYPKLFSGFTDRHVDNHHIRYYNADLLYLHKKIVNLIKKLSGLDMNYI